MLIYSAKTKTKKSCRVTSIPICPGLNAFLGGRNFGAKMGAVPGELGHCSTEQSHFVKSTNEGLERVGRLFIQNLSSGYHWAEGEKVG